MPCPCGRHRTPQACAGARYLASRSLEQRQADGHEGGAAQAALTRARLVERFAHLDRDAAIWAAHAAGMHTRKVREARTRKRAG